MKELYMIAVIPHFDIKNLWYLIGGFFPCTVTGKRISAGFVFLAKYFWWESLELQISIQLDDLKKKILVTWSVMGRLSKEFSVLTQDTLEQVYQYLNILFTSLVQTIKKVGRSWRFTVDCWWLNKVMLSKMLNTQKCC